MSDLDSIESSGDEWLEAFPAPTISRMRPNRESACFVGNGDRIFDGKPVLGNESAAVAAKVCHERVAEIVHNPARNQCARNVRTAHSSAVRLQQNFVQGDRYSQCVELLDDLFGAGVAQDAQLPEPLFESIEVR